MSSIVKQEKYILAEVGENHNKHWSIIWRDDNTVTTEWGRVGYSSQSKSFPQSSAYSAERFFGSKCREKHGKGYEPCETELGEGAVTITSVPKTALAEVAKKQIRTNSPETLKLVEHLAGVNAHVIQSQTTMQFDKSRGLYTTPLGLVRPAAIVEARIILGRIADFVVAQDWDNPALPPIVNKYLMRVPQNNGMGKPNLKVLYPNVAEIQRQNGILDALDASFTMAKSRPDDESPDDESPGDSSAEESLFSVRLHIVNDGKVIDKMRRLYKSTWQSIHTASTLDIKCVFEVEHDSMNEAFSGSGVKIGNVMELWHGTKSSNLLSLLKSGYIIPPASSPHCTGRLLGNGVYFSDQSTKSLNYAGGWAPGQSSGGYDGNAFMLLNDVAMGKPYHPTSYGENLPKPGSDSTFARGGTGTLRNNEMVVYSTRQINPKYLVQFSQNGR